MTYCLYSLNFVSTIPSTWVWPSREELESYLSTAILLDSEITVKSLGFYKPPKRIRKLKISNAAYDQIEKMWWGHRDRDAESPPAIPLKYFVFGFGQNPPDNWVDVEMLPGVDDWDVK